MNRILSASLQPPLAAEIDRLRSHLFGIVAIYDRVKDDPKASIPVQLSLTIEAARPVAPDAESERYRHEAAMDGDRERMEAIKASFPR